MVPVPEDGRTRLPPPGIGKGPARGAREDEIDAVVEQIPTDAAPDRVIRQVLVVEAEVDDVALRSVNAEAPKVLHQPIVAPRGAGEHVKHAEPTILVWSPGFLDVTPNPLWGA